MYMFVFDYLQSHINYDTSSSTNRTPEEAGGEMHSDPLVMVH